MTDRQAKRIRQIFQELGGAGISARDLAKAVRDADVFSPEERDELALDRIQDLCRRALKRRDPETGERFAAPDDEDNWTQLDLFSESEFESYLQRQAAGIDHDIAALRLDIDRFVARFGRRPSVQIAPRFPA
jgi:hypothetical protein